MDDLQPVEDWELLDEIDKAQLTLLYAMQVELARLSSAVDELTRAAKADRVTTMTARDGITLKATSKVKE